MSWPLLSLSPWPHSLDVPLCPCLSLFLCVSVSVCVCVGGSLSLSLLYFSLSVLHVYLCVSVSLLPSFSVCFCLYLSVREYLPLPISSPSVKYQSVWLIKSHYFSEHLPLKFQQMGRSSASASGCPGHSACWGLIQRGLPGPPPTPHLCRCQTCLPEISTSPGRSQAVGSPHLPVRRRQSGSALWLGSVPAGGSVCR